MPILKIKSFTMKPIVSLLLCLSISLHAQNKSIEYKLTIIDSETNSPVSYVAVSLLNPADSVLTTGITNEKGLFQAKVSQFAAKIRISCMGYITIEQALESNGAMNDLGTFSLSPQEHALEEVTVTGKRVQYDIDKTIHTVTNKMRAPVNDAVQLAGQLPGIRFDRIANDVRVDNQSSVLLLVNEVQRSKEYISSLSPNRIESIEVIKNPTGRFMSDDYYAIINYILKKDDAGYEVRFDNFTILDPAGNNGSDWLVNEQPKMNLSLFNKRIDANLNFVTARIRWNYPISLEQDYVGVYSLKSDDVTHKNPNQNYIYSGSGANAGVQVQITTGHSLFVGGNFGYDKSDENTTYQMLRRFSSHGFTDRFTDEHLNQSKIIKYTGSLTYIGQVSPKWQLKTDFAYNRNHHEKQNVYLHNHEESLSQYNISRDYIKLGVDGNYRISSKFNLNLGQVNTIRNYSSEAKVTNGAWERDEYRSRFYSYLTYRVNRELNFRLGGAWQYLNAGDDAKKQNFNSFQPSFRVNYTPNDYLNINGRFSAFSSFPSLYELSNNPVQLDSLMIEIGNPNLKPTTIQQASLGITLFNIFTITSQYSSLPTYISPIYEKRDLLYYRTWQNMQGSDFATILNVSTPLGDYFEIDASLAYHYQKARYLNLENRYNTWLGNATISFYHPTLALGSDLEYNRSMDKSVMVQGYGMNDMDIWQLTVFKQFWNRRGQLMVSYVMPVSWGRRTTQINAVETPFYTRYESFGLKTYDNMLFIRFSIRFDKGKKVFRKVEGTAIEIDEKTGRNLM